MEIEYRVDSSKKSFQEPPKNHADYKKYFWIYI